MIARVRRRRPHLGLGCVVAGLALAPLGPLALVAVAVAAALAALACFGSRAMVIAAGLVLLAGTWGTHRLDGFDRVARRAAPGTALQADATVLERPRRTRFGSAVTMKIDSGPARGLRIYARVDRGGWPAPGVAGLRVRLRGLVRDPAAPTAAGGAADSNAGREGTPGFGPLPRNAADDFDFAAFLRSRGIGREVQVESLRIIGRRGGPAGVIDAIRERAERAIGAGLDPQRAALARGMVLGDDTGVADDVRDDFQRSGLAHVLAASGQNVMLLCALALPLLMLARASPRTRTVVLLALVLLYVPLAGAGASVERAGVMAAAGLVALAAGRPASALYALLLAGAVTLGVNPRASGDPGWQLSFAAVGGMLVVAPRVRPALRGLPRPLAEAIAATTAATLSTAALMAHAFGAVSIAALPANIAALPAVAPVMWIGMGQAAVAQVAVLGPHAAALAGAIAKLAGRVNGVGVGWIAGVARHFAQTGWAQAVVHLSWPGVLVADLLLPVMALAAVAGARRMRARLLIAADDDLAAAGGGWQARLTDLLDAWRAMPRRTRVCGVLLIAAALGAVPVAVAGSAPRVRRLTVDYLDIGQGDATLIRDPDGATVLFDGGPPEARVDRLLHRLGVHALSIVVATHQSRDHHGGLLQVVKRFPVGLFVDGGDGTRDPSFLELEHEVARRHIRRIPSRAGQVLRAGRLVVRILSPEPRPPGPAPSDPNPRATVAIVSEDGFRLFLSADAESGPLAALGLRPVDAMKVPHHGSADPGLRALLSRLRPRVAGIEVGRGNDYGHPRRSTLDALCQAVPYVYRTDRDGTVELTVDRGTIDVRTHR